MLYRGTSSFIKVNNNTILSLSKDKNSRRGLLIYSYFLNISSGVRGIQTDVSKLVDLMGVGMSTGSKKSVGEALSILIKLNMISIYKDKKMIDEVLVDDIVKKSNKTFWIKTKPSQSEINYTLIPSDVVDDIVQSDCKEKPDDLFLVLSYICLKSERRENISPIMWSSIKRICKDIHITDRKLMNILNTLLDLNIIYFKKVNLSGGRSNYIYGLYEDREDVDIAVSIAEKNNRIDKRIKFKDVSDNVIDIVDGEFLIDVKLSNFFDRHKIDCNVGVADETNKFCQKHGHAKLMNILGEYNAEIYSADNKNGAYRSILRRNY